MDIKSQLNEQQFQAATSHSQYLRIIAGAGTGKTRTLTYRLAYLIDQGIQPKRIVAITFTNKAAKEMGERVEALLKEENPFFFGAPTICTFHSFCYKFLKREILHLPYYNTNFNVASDEDSAQIYKDIFAKMTKGISKEFTKAVTSKISALKTDGREVEDVRESDVPLGAIYNFDELVHVYKEYQNFLKTQNLLDFDDLLMLTLKIMDQNPDVKTLWRSRYDCFLVDEFQDTNLVQYRLIQQFLAPETMLTVVGDPDQTIYTWRGAQNNIIKDRLSKDYPTLETVVLDHNYRSTQNILNAANHLIKNNRDRMDKNLIAANEVEGERVEYTNERDADMEGYHVAYIIHRLHEEKHIPYDQFAVIYRSNYLSNAIEKQITRFKIPYEVYGGMKFYERAEIKDALAYLRLVINPDDLSFRRVLKAPSKNIGDVALAKAIELKEKYPEEETLFSIFLHHRDELHLMKKSIEALDLFYGAYNRMRQVYLHHDSPSDLITAITLYFSETKFMEYINREDKKMEEKLSYTASSSQSKMDNVLEFTREITEYFDHDVLDDEGNYVAPTLEDFLIQVALQSDQDAMKDEPKVALMTGHVSKGLEFPYVFVTGLNQQVFPTSHALMDYKGKMIEEERRLLYVCVTRAMKKLYLSSFGGMNFRGGGNYVPSMFLKELDILPKKKENPIPKVDYDAYKGTHRPSSNPALSSFAKPNSVNTISSSHTDNHYVVGDEIIHTNFGVGKVIQCLPGNKIKVQFKNEEYGIKTLMIGLKAFRKKTKED